MGSTISQIGDTLTAPEAALLFEGEYASTPYKVRFDNLMSGGLPGGGTFTLGRNSGDNTTIVGNAFGNGEVRVGFGGAVTKIGSNTSIQVASNAPGSGLQMQSVAIVFNEAGLDYDFRVEGDTLTHMLFLDAGAATENIALLAAAAPNWQTMDRGIYIGNASTVPTGNPSSGVFLYAESGALKCRGSSGTVTTLGPA